jgi:hypothetical protein
MLQGVIDQDLVFYFHRVRERETKHLALKVSQFKKSWFVMPHHAYTHTAAERIKQ